MPEQRLLVDSQEAAALALAIFPALRPIMANGQLPDDLRGAEHVLLMGLDAEWVEALETMLRSAGSAIVRAGVADFLLIDRAKPAEWLRNNIAAAPVAEQQTSSAPQAKQEVGAFSPADAAEPAVAEPPKAPTEAPKQPQGDDPGDWTTQVPAEGAEVPGTPRKRRQRPRLASVDGNTALAHEPDPEALPAELSEDQLAEHFVETRGERWRYCPELLTWLEWRGDGWHRDTLHAVAHTCKEITREALQWKVQQPLTADGKRKLSSKRMAWNVRDMSATHPKISILAAELDADPMLLGVPGGCVDLKTGKLLEANPADYITRRTLVAPADGPHPLFDRVLARACAEHDGMAAYLWRWFGYMLTGDVREESAAFLFGPGGSGKSTLIKCLTDIIGDYAVSISMEALLEQKNPRHTQEIAKLAGMRLIYASETSENRLWNEALLKDLTGRDKTTARFMRGNDFTFQPIGKLLLYGNAMPRLKSVGEEIRRRLHLIEYAGSLTPEERDSTLKDRLVDEYPMILASMIRGCIDWQDCAGLGKPESVMASVETYLEGEDSFALFIDECVHKDLQAREPSGEVYRRYRSWASAAGEYTMSQKRFVQTLRLRGFETIRATHGRMIAGLKLLPAPHPEPVRSYQDRD